MSQKRHSVILSEAKDLLSRFEHFRSRSLVASLLGMTGQGAAVEGYRLISDSALQEDCDENVAAEGL
jgi:hypothetical protein